MARKFVKYNPAFLEVDQLIANFVVRHADLDLLMGTIKENTTNSNQHILVIGPRGSGKTTLVRRVAAEIDRTEELGSRWYPLIFSEESYKATSSADFWLEALSHLADQAEDDKWMRSYEEIREESDDKVLGERALWQILDFADSQGKKVLLVVENFDMLFSDLISEDEAWKIRHTLLNEPRLMLLATATTKFDNLHNSSHALFEMFKMQELKPLDDEECNIIWELVAGNKLSGEQIRPVRILTGGNPRLIAIIAKFGAHRSFQQLLDDLVDLIDDHTDYFKSHLENMPAIERKVYLALAELWSISTAREVAKLARLEVNKTSSLLNRLAGRGAVAIEDRGKKNKLYRISEGIYNIYYLMRRRGRPADRVRAAVKFMVVLYGHESVTKMLVEEANCLSPDLCRDHYLAYSEVIKEISDRQRLQGVMDATPKKFLESPYIQNVLADLVLIQKQEIDNGKKDKNDAHGIVDLMKLGRRLLEGQKYHELAEAIDALMAKSKHLPGNLLEKAEALFMVIKGMCLAELGRFEEAVQLYNDVVSRYKDRSEVEIARSVASAMLNNGFVTFKKGRYVEAIKIFDEMASAYKDRTELSLVENVAIAMVCKGDILKQLNDFENALNVYDEVVKHYRGRNEDLNIEIIASAMTSKAIMLVAVKRFAEAVAASDEMIERFKESNNSAVIEQVVATQINKGVALGELRRPEEAVKVYDEVLTLYKNRIEQGVSREVAQAALYKGKTLARAERHREAEVALREAIAWFPELTPAREELIGLLLRNHERQSEVIEIAEATINRSPDDVGLLNKIAWTFYKNGSMPLVLKAEVWARKAAQLAPADLNAHHTLACLLSAIGKSEEALASAKVYIQDAAVVEKTIDDAIELFVELALSGNAKEALGILEPSPAARHLEPLIAGLKLYLGEDVKTAAEILEVAKDVVTRIEERKQRRA